MLQDYLDAMQIDRAKTVLDIGCGTGVATRAIALALLDYLVGAGE
jgi:predicted TPR repeat methyltransferase